MHQRFAGRLQRGTRVRIRVNRESREMGYRPCKDNTIAIFLREVKSNGREFAELHLPSGAKVKMAYDHIVEIVTPPYEIRKNELLEMAMNKTADD